ncbi:MAG: hypothetical protein PHI49_09210 [Halothiobacillaceae bacterium]|nr:hypothetical protein [Halothiobacillaceae bacterium]
MTKEDVIRDILERFGFLIDFRDDSWVHYKQSGKGSDDMTWLQWKKEFFSKDADVVVFFAYPPAGQQKIKRVKKDCNATHLIDLIDKINLDKEIDHKREIKAHTEAITRLYEKPGSETLDICMEEIEDKIAPGIIELMNRWSSKNKETASNEDLVKFLINKINEISKAR